MIINDHLAYLHRIITGVMSGDIVRMGIFNKLYAIGIVSIFQAINEQLEKLSEELDSELNLEAVSIRFDLYCRKDYWNKNWLFIDGEYLFSKLDIELYPVSYTSEINQMTDYLPNGVQGYQITPNVLTSFKGAMHQLCDDERMSNRDLLYALNTGLDKMLCLLDEVRKKVKNPQNHLYVKLWDELLEIYENDEFDKEYKEWIEDNGEPSLNELKARQKQEIFKFLNKNFLRYCNNPTGAEVKKCKLKITEDDLPYGTLIPESIAIECAKLERFIELKEEILTFNYEKLGQYLYKNYNQFEESEFFHITDFERIIDVINEAIAKHKPSLAKYLKRYEENQIKELYEDCKKVIITCKPFLKKDVRKTILEKYLFEILSDTDIKTEARKKLNGQSKIKYLCDMIAHLSNFYVFDVKYGADDFSKAMSKEYTGIAERTINRYIRTSINSRNGALYTWTKNNIDKLLKK